MSRLGVTREKIKVTVLKEGKHGILGLGSEEAMVRVEVIEPASGEDMPQDNQEKKESSNVTEETAEVVKKLLALMGVNASVIPEDNPYAEPEPGVVPPVTLNLEGGDLGILIGRRGQTLACFQYVVRLIMAHKLEMLVPVTIDVEGYKKRRYESLQAMAIRIADQVRSRHVPFTLEPMPPDERRVIHLALANDPNITTNSIGEGEERKVVISPA
jgi:spoIIIJ-associated protein